MNMRKVEDYLPHPEFLRTHRSYIVHMNKAEVIDRFRIVFGDQFIPVSDSYKEEVQQYIDIHTLV
jgi:DNA-binding LytR/AlgR family response regulator